MFIIKKLDEKMSRHILKKYGVDESLSLFGICTEQGFIIYCYYTEYTEPAEIKGFITLTEHDTDFWAENIIRGVINSLELNGGLFCIYKGTEYLDAFKKCRFSNENGSLTLDLKKFFASGEHCSGEKEEK